MLPVNRFSSHFVRAFIFWLPRWYSGRKRDCCHKVPGFPALGFSVRKLPAAAWSRSYMKNGTLTVPPSRLYWTENTGYELQNINCLTKSSFRSRVRNLYVTIWPDVLMNVFPWCLWKDNILDLIFFISSPWPAFFLVIGWTNGSIRPLRTTDSGGNEALTYYDPALLSSTRFHLLPATVRRSSDVRFSCT